MARQLIERPDPDIRQFIERLVRELNENFDHLDGQGSELVRWFKALEERVLGLEETTNADTVPEHDHSGEDEGDSAVQPVNDHIDDADGAHAASAIANTPSGGIAGDTVQEAIDELDSSKANLASAVMDGDAAGGDLGGTYPNPTVNDDSHAHTDATAPGAVHPDLATHDTLGLATQAELDVPVFQRAGQNINATISASENDWAPTGIEAATVVQVEVTAAADLTGIAATQDVGRMLVLYSKAASVADLTLQNADALSLAANRFAFSKNADIVLKPNSFLVLVYAATRWREYTDFDHRNDDAEAHPASAISIADAGAYFTGTDVETALQELGAGGGGGGAHPDLATHDTLGLATDAELAAHTHDADYEPLGEVATHEGQENPHGTELDDLTDVAAPAPNDGDVLTFDTTNGWQPEAPSGGGAHPDLATHDTLGLATQAELDAHDHDADYEAAGAVATHAATEHGVAEPFPVGAIFISAVSTDPATLLGYGTWSAFGAGRVLVGQDPLDTDFDTAEETGGAKTHTLTEAEIPDHTHQVQRSNATGTGANAARGANTNLSNMNTNSGAAGGSPGGGAHNNLQPYIVVYMWKRTA